MRRPDGLKRRFVDIPAMDERCRQQSGIGGLTWLDDDFKFLTLRKRLDTR